MHVFSHSTALSSKTYGHKKSISAKIKYSTIFFIFLLLNFWYLLFIVPSSPLNITNIHTKNDSVTLHWKEPESPNGIIIGYRLYYMTKKMTDVQTVKDSSKEIVYMLKNLSKLPPLS